MQSTSTFKPHTQQPSSSHPNLNSRVAEEKEAKRQHHKRKNQTSSLLRWNEYMYWRSIIAMRPKGKGKCVDGVFRWLSIWNHVRHNRRVLLEFESMTGFSVQRHTTLHLHPPIHKSLVGVVSSSWKNVILCHVIVCFAFLSLCFIVMHKTPL